LACPQEATTRIPVTSTKGTIGSPHTKRARFESTPEPKSETRSNPKEDPLLGQGHNKAADPAPDEECMRTKNVRVRKAVQNRCIDLLATDTDWQNRRRQHISGEVSPRQRCHCSSTLVSPRKAVGVVTAEYMGY